MLRFFKVEDRTLKRHKSIGVLGVQTSRHEKDGTWSELTWFETTVLFYNQVFHIYLWWEQVYNHMINRVGKMCVWKTPTLCERDTRQLWGTNLIHPLARDVKHTLLTRKRQLSADSDSNSLLGALLLVKLITSLGIRYPIESGCR
jgi:hypothetical protein